MAGRLIHLIRSNVVLFVALAVALTVGTAYAASTAPPNSVTSKSIKNGQVKLKDIAKKAVDGSKVKPNSLGGDQINESSLDANVLQRRITDACPSGQALAAVGANGSVTCVGTGGPPSGSAGGDLSGTYPNPSIATAAVTTLKLANDAVTSTRVENNSLTGNDIDESTLGNVLSATNATNAGDADTLDGTHAAGFLKTGDSAGGDVSGLYSNLQIAVGAVGNSEIANLSVTDAKVAGANKDGTAGTPSMRTLGTGAQQAMPGNATPGGPPTGAAAGALAGTYPSPTLNVTGGPCANGRALTNVSSGAALTCAPGVYSDARSNVAAGPTSFPALTTGIGSTAIGLHALQANTSGNYNSALGSDALAANTSGTYNSALGNGALSSNTAGLSNSAVGLTALVSNTTGNLNTALGTNALYHNTTGHLNVAIGSDAGYDLTTGSKNIDIGSTGVAGESNTIRIGQSPDQTKAFIAGITGVTTGGTASQVLVDGSGQLGTTSSSRRFKRDIEPLDRASRRLMELNPVSFRYKRSYVDGGSSRQFGLLAEQVARVYPNLVVYGKDGKPSAVAYQELPALLLAQAQRQEAQNDRLQGQVTSLRGKVRWLMRHTRSR